MKVSILYGKETLSTAGKKGYVLSVNVSGGKIVSYTCADENEKRFTIDADSVKSVKEKIVYVDGGKGAAGEPLRKPRQARVRLRRGVPRQTDRFHRGEKRASLRPFGRKKILRRRYRLRRRGNS